MNEIIILSLLNIVQILSFVFYFANSFEFKDYKYLRSLLVTIGISTMSWLFDLFHAQIFIKMAMSLVYIFVILFIYYKKDYKKALLKSIKFNFIIISSEFLALLCIYYIYADRNILLTSASIWDLDMDIYLWIGKTMYNLIAVSMMTIMFSIKSKVAFSIKIKGVLLTVSVFLLQFVCVMTLIQAENIDNHITVSVLTVASLMPMLIYYIGVFDIKQAVALKEKDIVASFSEAKSEQVMEYYKLASHYIKNTHKIKHDISNEIQCLKVLIETDKDKSVEFINEINRSLENIDKGYYTGYPIIDVLLTIKSDLATEQNISAEFTVNKVEKNTVSDIDMCNLLSNILDNAIEASLKLPENERRINLKMGKVGEYLSIKCENNFTGTISKNGNEFLTLKYDKKAHGYGISIIEDIAKKYNGECSIETKNNIFSLIVILRV